METFKEEFLPYDILGDTKNNTKPKHFRLRAVNKV